MRLRMRSWVTVLGCLVLCAAFVCGADFDLPVLIRPLGFGPEILEICNLKTMRC